MTLYRNNIIRNLKWAFFYSLNLICRHIKKIIISLVFKSNHYFFFLRIHKSYFKFTTTFNKSPSNKGYICIYIYIFFLPKGHILSAFKKYKFTYLHHCLDNKLLNFKKQFNTVYKKYLIFKKRKNVLLIFS